MEKKLYQTPKFWYWVIGIVLFAIIAAMIMNNGSSNPQKGTKNYKDENGNVVSFNPVPYTDNLHDEIYSYRTSLFAFQKPYEELYNLNDTEFAMVAEYWNKRYFSEDKETLRMAIYKELNVSLQDELQAKFKRLNIA